MNERPGFGDAAPDGFNAPALAIFSRPEQSRGPLLTSALLAVCLHAGLLFGLRSGAPQIIVPSALENSGVEISLENPPSAAAAPPSAPSPEPAPDSEPAPEPPLELPLEPALEPAPPPEPAPEPPPEPAPEPVPAAAPKPAPNAEPERTPRPKPAAKPPGVPPPNPGTGGRDAAPAFLPPQAGPAAVSSEAAAANPPPNVGPSPLENIRPVYPDMARRRGQEGRVLLRVGVDAHGSVTRIAVEDSSGYSLLDQAARNAVRQWRFHPARLAGAPVAGEVLVPVDFRLR